MIHTDGRPTIASRVSGRCERCWEPECGGDCGFPTKPLGQRVVYVIIDEAAHLPSLTRDCDGYPGLAAPLDEGTAELRYGGCESAVEVTTMGDAEPRYCCGDPGDCGTCGR